MTNNLKYKINILVYDRPLECYIDNNKLSYRNWQNENHYESYIVSQGQHDLIFEEPKWCESGYWMLLFFPLSLLLSIITFPKYKSIYVDGKRPYKDRLILPIFINSNVNITVDAKPKLKDSTYTLTIDSLTVPTKQKNTDTFKNITEKCSKKCVIVSETTVCAP